MSKIVIRSKVGLFVQLLGVVSSYISIFLIARFEGPASQGFFVTIKSFIDTAYALFMAGLPQALILVINRNQFNVRSAVPRVELYIVCIFLLSIPITWKFMWLDVSSSHALVFIPVGITGMSIFALTRALLLTRTDGLFFSLFTAAPPSLILLYVALNIFVSKSGYLYVYFYFGITLFVISQSVILTLYCVNRAEARVGIPFRRLFSENVHSFAQAVLYNGQLFLVLRLLHAFGVLPDDIGKISTAILPLLALHALIGVVAPMLYNQWSKQDAPTQLPVMIHYLSRIALLGQGLAILSLPLVRPVTIFVFGAAYADSVPAIWVVLFAVFPVIFSRLLSPYLQTSGRAVLNSASCLVRFSAVIGLLLISLQLSGSFSAVFLLAVVWGAAEWLALVFLLVARPRALFAPRLIHR